MLAVPLFHPNAGTYTMTATATKPKKTRKPRVKPERRITMQQAPNADGKGAIVEITVGKETDFYFVDKVPSDFGTAFKLEKCNYDGNDTTYHTLLDGQRSSCECKGYLRHHHCKHIDGLTALVQLGKL
jgi:hypothetical protein